MHNIPQKFHSRKVMGLTQLRQMNG